MNFYQTNILAKSLLVIFMSHWQPACLPIFTYIEQLTTEWNIPLPISVWI